ncbi:MAG TPA: hypothetical protein VFA12_20585 [Stellaceae bacterium]|nr:hypothetical protein [Stellaceae bacterium]
MTPAAALAFEHRYLGADEHPPVEPPSPLAELEAVIERRRKAGDERPFMALTEHERRICREWGIRW